MLFCCFTADLYTRGKFYQIDIRANNRELRYKRKRDRKGACKIKRQARSFAVAFPLVLLIYSRIAIKTPMGSKDIRMGNTFLRWAKLFHDGQIFSPFYLDFYQWTFAESFSTVRDAANITSVKNALKIGTIYIAERSPAARKGSIVSLVKLVIPAEIAACCEK